MKPKLLMICCSFLLMQPRSVEAQLEAIKSPHIFAETKTKGYNFYAVMPDATKTETINGVKITTRFFVDNVNPLLTSKDPGKGERKAEGKKPPLKVGKTILFKPGFILRLPLQL